MKKLSSNSFKVSVAPTSGADATTYWLVPSTTQVKREADGTHLPEYVSCESMAKTGDDAPVSGIGTVKFVLTYKSGSVSTEFIYASRIIVTADMAGIVFKQYVGGNVVDTKTVTVVDDGGQGLPGPAGVRGRLPFPSGKFNMNEIYTCTDDITPIVYYELGETYYVMRQNGNSVGINPMEDYRDNPITSKWIPFENYKAIFTDILMADFAKLASAVFYGDYMFSQQGIDLKGNETSEYKKFNPSSPNSGSFVPNYYLNAKTGKVRLSDVTATGSFTASPILVTTQDSTFGGNFSSKSGIYAASVPKMNNTYQYGYGSLALGFMIGGSATRWTDVTIINVSDTPLFIDAAFPPCPNRVFVYNGKMYYGLRITSKYRSVRFMLLTVPLYQYEYGNGIDFYSFDRMIQVEGNGLMESTINHYLDGQTYQILQI